MDLLYTTVSTFLVSPHLSNKMCIRIVTLTRNFYRRCFLLCLAALVLYRVRVLLQPHSSEKAFLKVKFRGTPSSPLQGFPTTFIPSHRDWWSNKPKPLIFYFLLFISFWFFLWHCKWSLSSYWVYFFDRIMCFCALFITVYIFDACRTLF